MSTVISHKTFGMFMENDGLVDTSVHIYMHT